MTDREKRNRWLKLYKNNPDYADYKTTVGFVRELMLKLNAAEEIIDAIRKGNPKVVRLVEDYPPEV